MRHTGTMPYNCQVCGKAFRYKANLREHVYIHNGEPKPFQCRIKACNKTFFTIYKLDVHMECHLGTQSYECDICNKKFKQKKMFASSYSTTFWGINTTLDFLIL